MYGDIIYVDRQPLLWRSTKSRENPNTKRLDLVIFRTTKYRHYGIDLGDGKVIHFIGDSFWSRQESRIEISTMDEFLKDGNFFVVSDIKRIYSREVVVERAISCIDTNFGGYSILDNNCEHFALWCSTGQRISSQGYFLKYGYRIAVFPRRRLLPLSKKILSFATGTTRGRF